MPVTRPDSVEVAGSRILIVDDIPANLKVLREVLEPRGYRILLAPRGEVALRIAASERPDLILLDVMMPEMDGLEVCRRLKAGAATAEIPVIFITAKDEVEDIVKGLETGGVDYISKPFQTEVVLARTETHLRNSKLAQALRLKNQELEIARETAVEAKRAQSAFLATMSHEIRTPMNSVLGMTALLLETKLTPEQRDFVETIRTGSRSLLQIIDEILDFSKIESGKMTLEQHPFEVNACVEEILDLLSIQAAEKNLDLSYLPDPDVPSHGVGDPTRLRQILLNLASNAVKFTPKGEIVIRVQRARSEPEDAGASTLRLHFSVRDTGIGIPADRRERLFQAFTQMDSSTTRQFGGTGLGLAISKRLTELMGGKMWAESEPQMGSTFHFTVPFQPIQTPSSGPPPALPALAGKSAVVIEDNAVNREILAHWLGALAVQVRGATNATEALAALESAPADLIILDLQLPDQDALELALSLRRLPQGRAAELFFLSSRPLLPQDPRATSATPRAVITKPLRSSQFHSALRRVIDPSAADASAPASQGFDSKLAERLPLRILLADDHLVNQKVGARILESFGYRCELAGNGQEVIQALERQPFDLVLLDVQMPIMDGYETARQIRQRWTEAERPRIVAMTANALRGDREKCLAAGMDDYLAKPIEISEVRQALERCGTPPGASRPAAAAPEPASASTGAAPAPVSQPVAADSPVDWARLDQLTNRNAETLGTIFQIYQTQTSEQIEALETALNSGDAAEAHRLAHKCKGASATCGFAAMVEPMRAIERMAQQGDLSSAPALLAQAKAAYAQTRELVTGHLQSL